MSDDTKPVRKPREQLSLKLSPKITGAVRILAEQYRKTQGQVLEDLAAGCEGMMLTRLESQAVQYAKERDQEIAVALGRNTPGPSREDVLALRGGLSAGLSPDTSMEPPRSAYDDLEIEPADPARDTEASAAVLTRSPADDEDEEAYRAIDSEIPS